MRFVARSPLLLAVVLAASSISTSAAEPKRVQKKWEQDIHGYIAKGQANWPGVLSK
jgi:hypothetical protein